MINLLQQLNFQNLSPKLAVCALILARIMPIVILAPFLGGKTVPGQVKMGIGVVFTIAIFPFMRNISVSTDSIIFVILMLKEIFVGATIALISAFTFETARAAGTYLDTAAGTAQAQIFVPQTEERIPIFADLNFQLTVLFFLALNGHHIIIEALFLSFQALPVEEWPKFSHGLWPLFETILRVGSNVLVVAISLAAPAAIATLITDIALGLINKVAPQVQVFFISMSIKPTVACVLTLCALTVFYDKLQHCFHIMINQVKHVLFLFS
jgi:flagellar biosynthetic protein FliR